MSGFFISTILDMATAVYDTSTSFCCGSSTILSHKPVIIGTRQYRILRQLGEGGFSHVLLVEDVESGLQYAMKKIICHKGTDAQTMAQREIEACRRFKHTNIIPLIDYTIDNNSLSDASIAYMLFPVYKRGNLFDLTMHNEETGQRLEEDFIINIFKGICNAVAYLHNYGSSDKPITDIEGDINRASSLREIDLRESEDQQTRILQSTISPKDTALSKTSYNGYEQISQTSTEDNLQANNPIELSSYAHRDIKLANVMLLDDGKTPILMDFGSIRPGRIIANSRSDALHIQDDASENCTMSYRAPELFDIQSGAIFDERTDIWSLGCLLFALAYNYTPFEDPQMGPGASIALAAINGKYSYPIPNPYSDRIRQLVDFMLEPDPKRRPFISQVIALTNSLYP